MIFTPEMNDGKSVFVYGANEAGRHDAGAAKEALLHWGAKYGYYGLMGNSYGIPTKDCALNTLSLEEIRKHINHFIDVAKADPGTKFLVTKIGCGLAGLDEMDITPLFADAPENCVLPDYWREWNEVGKVMRKLDILPTSQMEAKRQIDLPE